jgi:choline transport protein
MSLGTVCCRYSADLHVPTYLPSLSSKLCLLTSPVVIWSVSGVTIISATLLFASAGTGYQSPSFVFTKFVNHTGWPNGIAWSLGLLQGSLALTGYDAVAHMIEEIPHASREGPKIMIYAVLIGMVTGFGFLLVLLFCMGSIEEVISAPCG